MATMLPSSSVRISMSSATALEHIQKYCKEIFKSPDLKVQIFGNKENSVFPKPQNFWEFLPYFVIVHCSPDCSPSAFESHVVEGCSCRSLVIHRCLFISQVTHEVGDLQQIPHTFHVLSFWNKRRKISLFVMASLISFQKQKCLKPKLNTTSVLTLFSFDNVGFAFGKTVADYTVNTPSLR